MDAFISLQRISKTLCLGKVWQITLEALGERSQSISHERMRVEHCLDE
jgi:hypothetical protein